MDGPADQTTKMRGMFVHPHQIADVAKRFSVIQRVRMVVENPDGSDRMRVLCALSDHGSNALRGEIEGAVREVTKLRGDVEFVEMHALTRRRSVMKQRVLKELPLIKYVNEKKRRILSMLYRLTQRHPVATGERTRHPSADCLTGC